MGGWFHSPPWHRSPPWATQALAPVWMTSSLAEGKKDVFLPTSLGLHGLLVCPPESESNSPQPAPNLGLG